MTQKIKKFKETQNTRNIKNRTVPQYRRLNVGFERAYLSCFHHSFSLYSRSRKEYIQSSFGFRDWRTKNGFIFLVMGYRGKKAAATRENIINNGYIR